MPLVYLGSYRYRGGTAAVVAMRVDPAMLTMVDVPAVGAMVVTMATVTMGSETLELVMAVVAVVVAPVVVVVVMVNGRACLHPRLLL